MSVYHEAIQSGRLHASDYPTIPAANGKPGRKSYKGIRSHLRDVKRGEAEDRNAATPFERTKRFRRELAASLAAASKKRKARSDA